MKWLKEYAQSAAKSDQLHGAPNHAALLAAGLMGEAGSILAELKKARRERNAYPAFRHRMLEEVGDFLWYFVRLATLEDNNLIHTLSSDRGHLHAEGTTSISLSLEFGSRVGKVAASVNDGVGTKRHDTSPALRDVWQSLLALCQKEGIGLRDAAWANTRKTESRWPTNPKYHELFDEDLWEEEKLPRKLRVDFIERKQKTVILRCNGINFGNRITDNIKDADDYRFHDIFHFSYAVHLGWSPVMRALLTSKRKSDPKIDEAEDGARAGILEEAIAATVFARAKELEFFQGIDHVDYDLLKTIQVFIRDYEVGQVPLWQWERAILDGYRVFRELRLHRGGTVVLNLKRHTLTYSPPRRQRRGKPR